MNFGKRSSTIIQNLIFSSFYLQEKNVTNILNITYVHNGLLYKVNISLLFHKKSLICNKNTLIFDCYIGTKNVNTHFGIAKDTCTEMKDTVVSGKLIFFKVKIKKKKTPMVQYNHSMYWVIEEKWTIP